MKKALLTFLALIFSTNFVFAEGECLIKDKTAPALSEYIKNNQTILKEITNQAGKTTETNTGFLNNIETKFNNILTNIIKTGSSIFNFDGFFSYFKYYAVFPISNEIPHEIWRDYNLLKNEDDGLNKYFNNIVKKGKSNLIIKDICSKVNNKNCNEDIEKEISIADLMTKLRKNNDNILNLYRKTVMGDVITENVNLILIEVEEKFREELETHYSPAAYAECSKEEGGFFDRIGEKIDDIINWQTLAKDGIQKWKDAWALLMGNDTSTQKYQELERELLTEYLSEQGIYGDSQQNALSALDKFNQDDGLSRYSNFIHNTFNNTKNKLWDKMKGLWDDDIQDFFEKLESRDSEGNVPIGYVLTAQENSTNTNLIKERIEKTYLLLSNLEAASETNVTTLISKIIEVFGYVADTIDVLTETCEISVQVCRAQDPNRGDCGKCN